MNHDNNNNHHHHHHHHHHLDLHLLHHLSAIFHHHHAQFILCHRHLSAFVGARLSRLLTVTSGVRFHVPNNLRFLHQNRTQFLKKKTGNVNVYNIFLRQCKYISYGSFPKCLFPDLIVWYFLMGARFLFNTFLMHVSHQDTMISSSSYIPEPINVACAVRFWAGGT